jgi:nitrite reductase (cytochrome c-552)
MDLTITRPAFVEAMNRRGIDVNKATHQEMRSYVCAQCHVEYYFKGDGKYLTFPWDKAPKHRGVSVDDIAAYYQESGFTDWVHPLSKTPMIKIQHPDYELWSNGVHAYRGVSCADCHMPYKTEGGVKVTDHQVKSPLLGNIAVSCQVCHRWSENEIRTRVESIQDKTMELMDKAEIAIIAAHNGVAECLKLGFTDDELKPARTLIREAQLRWDFIAAENSTGFHAPQEAARILGIAIDQGRQAELLALGLRLKKAGGAPVAASDPGK